MRVLLVDPNIRMDTLIPVGLSLLCACLKREGHEVDVFDTTFMDSGYQRGDIWRQETLQVISTQFADVGIRREQIDIAATFREKIRIFRPDLIAISNMEVNYDFTAQVLLRDGLDLSDPNRPFVILGGMYPTFAPNEVIRTPGVDLMCQWEGERTIVQVMRALQRGVGLEDGSGFWGIGNLWIHPRKLQRRLLEAVGTDRDDLVRYLRAQLGLSEEQLLAGLEGYRIGVGTETKVDVSGRGFDSTVSVFESGDGIFRNVVRENLEEKSILEENPWADWVIWDDRRFAKPMRGNIFRTGTFEMSRGCPYRCTYCCNDGLQQLFGKAAFHRERSVADYVAEVKHKIECFGLDFMYIVDESFLSLSEKRFNGWVEGQEEINAYYRSLGKGERIPFFANIRAETVRPGWAKKLVDLGLSVADIGIESGNLDYRRTILDRKMTNEQLRKAFEEFKESGVKLTGNAIIGMPDETPEIVFETIELFRFIDAPSITVNIFAPYRGTTLRDRSIAAGYLKPRVYAGDYRGESSIDMPHFPRREIESFQQTFILFVRFSKSRWDDIEMARREWVAGNEARLEDLKKEYMETTAARYGHRAAENPSYKKLDYPEAQLAVKKRGQEHSSGLAG